MLVCGEGGRVSACVWEREGKCLCVGREGKCLCV